MTSSKLENTTSSPNHLTYHDAGVDIDAGNRLVNNIKPLAKRTLRPGVLAGIGGFGALFELSSKHRNPVLVSATDGVGTKLKFAFQLDKHDSIGIDLVAMSVNDILVQGAEPLFFLDYFACGKLDVATATAVVSGISNGCELAGCALIGGETAEMPDMYPPQEYDLAGFAVGVVEKEAIIDGKTIQPSDVVIGIASNGAHANGYSLIRKIIGTNHSDLSVEIAGKKLSDALMTPTRIYVKPLLELIKQLPVKGIAHITGGGLVENLPRILPDTLMAILQKNSWSIPPIFHWLQQHGNITDEEMYRVFNCGIGMVLVVAPEHANRTLTILQACGETVWPIGEIRTRNVDDLPIMMVK